MNDPLLSIIVPIYKVEPYLRQCIDSIVLQTYRNLEIILVDDGSPDNCPAICDEYEKTDKRIRVIHKENGGLSDARNAGLDIATGDLIGFVDSDDWLAPDMYEELMQTLLETHADIAICGYIESTGKRELAKKSLAGQRKTYTVEEAFRELLLSGEIMQVMWNKLYRRNLFDDIRFPKGETFEDGAVFFKLFGKCSCIAHTGKVGYYYRKRSESITFTDYNTLVKQIRKNYEHLLSYLTEHYPTLVNETSYYGKEMDYYVTVKYLQAGCDLNSPEYRRLLEMLKRDLPDMLNHPRWSLGKKIKVILVITGFYTPVRKAYLYFKNRKSVREYVFCCRKQQDEQRRTGAE